MTPDLDAIRAALVAATPGPWSQGMIGDRLIAEVDYSAAFGFIVIGSLSDDGNDGLNDAHLVANAPSWLAALCTEVEHFHAVDHMAGGEILRLASHRDSALSECAQLRAERDAALAEVERLRAANRDFVNRRYEKVADERDAALAERDEWRARYEYPWQKPYDKSALEVAVAERDAALTENERLATHWREDGEYHVDLIHKWRACADRLADRLDWRDDRSVLVDADKEALAVYEQLKGQQ